MTSPPLYFWDEHFAFRFMDADGDNGSKLDMQKQFANFTLDEQIVIDNFVEQLKKLKESLETTHSIALKIDDVTESSSMYVSDSDVEDVHRSSTPIIRGAAIKIEEKPRDDHKDVQEMMLKCLIPSYK